MIHNDISLNTLIMEYIDIIVSTGAVLLYIFKGYRDDEYKFKNKELITPFSQITGSQI